MSRRLWKCVQPSGQALVEFLLIFPLICAMVLGIIEAGRITYSFLSVENAARHGIRYAVTGEWSSEACTELFGEDCVDGTQEQAARVLSVEEVALAGSSSIFIDGSAAQDEPGYFDVTTCSHPGMIIVPSSPLDSHRCVDENGDPYEFAGDPGEYVVVVVDYNFPLVVPFLNQVWPFLHLSSSRLARVENYRTSDPFAPPPSVATASATSQPTATSDHTATFTPAPSMTPTRTNTPGPDCNDIVVSNIGVDQNSFYFDIQNFGSTEAYLQGSDLIWSVNGTSGFDYFYMSPYDPQKYYDPVSLIYTSPISGSVIYERILADWMGPQTWKAVFDQIPEGEFQASLHYEYWYTGVVCDIVVEFSQPTPTPSPTPDCGWLVKDGPFTYDETTHRWELHLGNISLTNHQLTGTTFEWSKQWESQYLDWMEWNGAIYYNGDDTESPTIINSNPPLDFPFLKNITWFGDFHVDDPPGPLMGYRADYVLTLTFDDGCQVVKEQHMTYPTPTPGPTADCGDLVVTDVRVNEDDFEILVSNQTQKDLTLWDAKVYWPDDLGMDISMFSWRGAGYDFHQYSSSPTTSEIANMIFPANRSDWFEVDFDSTPPEGIWGYFKGDLRFLDPNNGAYCPVSADIQVAQPPTPTPTLTPTITPTPTISPTPTITPTPDCSKFVVTNVNFGTNDFRFDIQNQNAADAFLEETELLWPADGSGSFDNFYIGPYGATTYYNPYSPVYTSPVYTGVNPEIRLTDWMQPQTWEANFHQRPGGLYQAKLTYGFWYTGLKCEVTASANYTPPTPTNTQPATKTPTPTNTPSSNPDCNKLIVNNVQFNGNDFEFYVRNDNSMPAYLTNSSLYFPVAIPMQFNEKRFNSTLYYTTNSYFSPVNASAPSMLLAAGANRKWEASFNNANFNGTYQGILTFNFPGWGNCQVSGVKSTESQSTATPTNSPTATHTATSTAPAAGTNTPTPTPTPTRTPTGIPPTNTVRPPEDL